MNIRPRFVKQDKSGLRPFQQRALEAIKDSESRLIFIEAPVGAGKSYIIRTLLNMKEFERRPLILTYPTKILMETQVAALETEMGEDNLGIWPSRKFVEGKANLILYNSDSLIRAVELSKFDPRQGRGDLLRQLFFQLAAWAKRGAIVTSPDVLWLLYGAKAYDGALDIQNKLSGSVAVFDEFHLYGELANFPRLVDMLLSKNVDKVILLSATPYASSGLKEVADRFPIKRIDFEETSEADECGRMFNHPLDISVQTFKTTDVNQMAERIIPLIKNLPKPMAVICESVFRLEHLRRRLQKEAMENVKLAVWSGIEKDRGLKLNKQTVLLGTSAIEVGIDFKFESLVFEAQVWTSAIQRLGRVGRHSPGIVVMMTRKADVETLIAGRTEFGRTQFEREILFEALNDPRAEHETGHSFRGQNYNFLLIDQELRRHFVYHERLFCLYDVDDSCYEGEWQNLRDSEKEKALREFGIPQSEWKELLIRDRLFPFWGIVRGRLRKDKYFFANDMFYYPNPDRNELHVLKPKRFVFTGKDFEA
jgi:CRISPR-associated endonuclease/helicase Cas3